MRVLVVLGVVWAGWLQASAAPWIVTSPVHGQTFSFGSARSQQWIVRGPNHHLALSTEFTNDPYVDRFDPRQYDYFIFDFPSIALGSDGRTFYYHPKNGRALPVATRAPGFLGVPDTKLLGSSFLVIRKPHGYLTVSLVIGEPLQDQASL